MQTASGASRDRSEALDTREQDATLPKAISPGPSTPRTMPADPRCPSCGEKVGARARWCMHCSAEFDRPVAAGSGHQPSTDRQSSADREASTGRGASATWNGSDDTGGDAAPTSLRRAVARFDDADSRQSLSLLGGVLAFFVLSVVTGGPGSGLLALGGAVALGAFLTSRDTAAEVLVWFAFGTGVLAATAGVLPWLLGVAAVPGATGVVVGVALVVGGRRLQTVLGVEL